ncbi:shikimate dehydrogenase [uncultured Ruegeria sp.]|uniref:shikimate dehydrogenase family protein n=1 Tax=uncultured Ruegeria sp. TaxID=259304 RepID=UPI0026383EF5|nr:shikimate dehydrogenase [uncultured Ruegeria sp.]
MDIEQTSISVSGETRLVLVIGHPTSQTKSPALMSLRAAQAGSNTVFVPADIHPADLGVTLEGLRQLRNLAGFVVTIPHKPTFLELVDEVSTAAKAVGAINVVRVDPDGRWIADILDGEGFVRGLQAAGVDPTDRSVQIFGGGGAGAAVAYAIARAGAADVRISDIDEHKVAALVSRLSGSGIRTTFAAGAESLPTADIVINASPVGMHGKGEIPFDADLLEPRQVVAELVMEPAETSLLKAARAAGCKTVPGYATLNGQSEAMMEFLRLLPTDGGTAGISETSTRVSKEENL